MSKTRSTGYVGTPKIGFMEYAHHCTKCSYLGQHVDNKQRTFDLYRCGKDKYLARFGNKPSDYIKGIPFHGGKGPLNAAHRLFKSKQMRTKHWAINLRLGGEDLLDHEAGLHPFSFWEEYISEGTFTGTLCEYASATHQDIIHSFPAENLIEELNLDMPYIYPAVIINPESEVFRNFEKAYNALLSTMDLSEVPWEATGKCREYEQGKLVREYEEEDPSTLGVYP